MQWVRRRWLMMAVPVLVCAVLALSDIRFAFAGLIVLFLILPFVVFNVHFYGLLSPEMRQRLHRQFITLTYGVKVNIYYVDDPAIADDNENISSPPPDEVIDWSEIERIYIEGDYWIVRLRRSSGHSPSFFVIPRAAINADISYPQFYE